MKGLLLQMTEKKSKNLGSSFIMWQVDFLDLHMGAGWDHQGQEWD